MPLTPPAPTDLVRARAQGLQLMAPLKPVVDGLTVTDAESYLVADGILGRIRTVRKQWIMKLDPIRGPLQRAIEAQKEALKQAKEAALGADGLHKELDAPMEALELRVKGLMADYKRRELQESREAQMRADEDARQKRIEADLKQRQAEAARTPQLKAKLQQQAATLQSQAHAVELEQETRTPVKGGQSTARTRKVCRVTDLAAFVAALVDYEPKAGIYRMNYPPLSVIPREALQTAINKLYAKQPGVVATWAGVEIVDDVIIANR